MFEASFSPVFSFCSRHGFLGCHPGAHVKLLLPSAVSSSMFLLSNWSKSTPSRAKRAWTSSAASDGFCRSSCPFAPAFTQGPGHKKTPNGTKLDVAHLQRPSTVLRSGPTRLGHAPTNWVMLTMENGPANRIRVVHEQNWQTVKSTGVFTCHELRSLGV